jgi:hypothetical protein
MEIETTQLKKEDDFEMVQPSLEALGLKPGMTRSERRAWYRENKRKLNLPPWDQLVNIKATQHGIES